MGETVTIPSRFSGPPGVGNGGYSCGRFAALLGGAAEVTLRRPVPLERALQVQREGATIRILDGAQLIAEVAPVDLAEIQAPPAVTLEQAVVGASHFPLAEHPFPTCFVCGPRREKLDGLRIHAYSVPNLGEVASPWVPSPELADAKGNLPPEIIWASLDCPTGWAGIAQIPGGVGASWVDSRFASMVRSSPIERTSSSRARLAAREKNSGRAAGSTRPAARCAQPRAPPGSLWIDDGDVPPRKLELSARRQKRLQGERISRRCSRHGGINVS